MCIILLGIVPVCIMVYLYTLLQSSGLPMVQISPELSNFSEGLATLSQARYHSNDCGQCHLRSLLDCKLDNLFYGVLEYSEPVV